MSHNFFEDQINVTNILRTKLMSHNSFKDEFEILLVENYSIFPNFMFGLTFGRRSFERRSFKRMFFFKIKSNFKDTSPKKLFKILKNLLKKNFYTSKYINYIIIFIFIPIKGVPDVQKI